MDLPRPAAGDAARPGVLSEDEQAAFLQSAENVKRAALKHLGALPDALPGTRQGEASAIAFVANLQHGVDSVVDAAVRRGLQVACRAGCSHCCNTRVEAMAPEVFRIAAELGQRPADERSATIARLEAHAATTPPERMAWSERTPCPFLVEHLCSIYPVRPAACRSAHSIDVNACEAQAAVIPQHLEMVLATEALSSGTSAAYRERGLDGAGHELVGAVLLALRDSSAAARWHRGERVFAAPSK